jgi:hypothetical protein
VTEAQYPRLLELAKRFYVDRFLKFTKEDLKKRYNVRKELLNKMYNELIGYEKQVIQNIFDKGIPKVETVKKEVSVKEHLERIRQNRLDESVKSGEASKIKEGFIYLIENPVWNGWIKGGMTLDYEERLEAYNMYDPTKSYRLLMVKWVRDRTQSEDNLLQRLHEGSAKQNGEWFKIDKEKALLDFEKID